MSLLLQFIFQALCVWVERTGRLHALCNRSVLCAAGGEIVLEYNQPAMPVPGRAETLPVLRVASVMHVRTASPYVALPQAVCGFWCTSTGTKVRALEGFLLACCKRALQPFVWIRSIAGLDI